MNSQITPGLLHHAPTHHHRPPPPPSSFSRSHGQSTVKDSLRRIPSSLFTKADDKTRRPKADKLTIYKDDDAPPPRKSSLFDSRRPLFTSPKRTADKEKVKTTGKTRKALADILHWGNSQSPGKSRQQVLEKVSASGARLGLVSGPIYAQHAVPLVPPKDTSIAGSCPSGTISQKSSDSSSNMSIGPPPVSRKQSSRLLKKKPSRPSLPHQPSRSGLSALTSSLRGKSPVQDVTPRARPSMAPDPFERTDGDVEVVETIPCRVGSISSVSTSLDRRGSISSRKALSTKTVSSATGSTKILPEVPPFTKSLQTLVEPSTVRPKHTSVPVAPRSPLVNLPPRTASLGRVLGDIAAASAKQDQSSLPSRPAIHSLQVDDVNQRQREAEIKARAVPSPISLGCELTPFVEETSEAKTLKREKTKSKVWTLFRGKKGTASIEAPKLLHDRPVMTLEPPRLTQRKVSVRKPVPLLDPSDLADHSQARSAPTLASRPRPPALHLIKPSIDGPSLHASLSASNSPPPFADLLPKSASSNDCVITPTSATHGIAPSLPSSFHKDNGRNDASATSVGSDKGASMQSRKPMPKRKSLSGLFGLAMRKSFDRLKPDLQSAKSGAPPSSFTLGKAAAHKAFEMGNESLSLTSSPKGSKGHSKATQLRSLAEEIQDADSGLSSNRHSSPPFSRHEHSAMRDASSFCTDRDISHVASATDKLYDLVEHCNFSPAPTVGVSPASTSDQPSLTSIEVDGSPTPMRRVRSAVLTSKKSKDSPMRSGTNISPLKLALHRSQMAHTTGNQGNKAKKARPVSSPADSPPRTSMVKKGMRNIFAPPSPPPAPAFSLPGYTQTQQPRFLNAPQLGLPLPPPQNRISPRRQHTEPPPPSLPPVPASAGEPRKSSIGPDHLGINQLNRDDLRGRIASDLLSPDIESDNRHSFDFTGEYASLNQGDKRFSFVEALAKVRSRENLALPALPPVPPPNLIRTLEPLLEDQSFRVASAPEMDDDSDSELEDEDCIVVPQIAYRASRVSASPRVAKSSTSSTSTVQRRSPRPPPFQGNPAFQMRVSQLKESMTPPASIHESGPHSLKHNPSLTALISMVDEPEASLPAHDASSQHSQQDSLEAPRPAFSQSHDRAESGVSIATMSSLGAVIETGIAGEYTNYFEVNFTKHLREQSEEVQAHTAPLSSIPAASCNVSKDSIIGPMKRHHRRQSSIGSIDSIPGLENLLMPNGPPISMYNSRRNSHVSYVSRHRRGFSGGGSFGRPDWAAHRRSTSSVDSSRSAMSTTSIGQLGRPGLGEKMFELDGGVQLTSIAASPSVNRDDEDNCDDADEDWIDREDSDKACAGSRNDQRDSCCGSPATNRASRSSWDSVLDTSFRVVHPGDPMPKRTSWDSILDSSFRAVPPGARMPKLPRMAVMDDDDSFFAQAVSPEPESREDATLKPATSGFFLQPLRPISMVSSATSVGDEGIDDMCINVAKYAKRLESVSRENIQTVTAQAQQCFEGEGEDESMTQADLSISTGSNGSTQRLGSTFCRPVRPRRKPAHLIFKDAHQPDTPVLSSPSASESSSRLSLETRFSDGASSFSASRLRPLGAGHARQKSSQGVTVHPTIKEEPSLTTLRAKISPRNVQNDNSTIRVAGPGPRQPIQVKSWYADGEEEEEEVEDQEMLQQMKKWSELRHEAEYECRRGKMLWQDPRSSSYEEFSPPKTVRGIMDFLAKSQATYRPLEEKQSSGNGVVADRRKSSFKEVRPLMSPYGLPLPKSASQVPQRPKGSLQTKFERTNSSASTNSRLSFGPDGISEACGPGSGLTPRSSSSTSPFAALFPELVPPPSAIFAQFTRELPPSPPPILPSHAFTPFRLPPMKMRLSSPASPQTTTTEVQEVMQDTKRSRVTSSARRKALGWGRRRNSDGPTQVESLARGAEAQHLPSMPVSHLLVPKKEGPSILTPSILNSGERSPIKSSHMKAHGSAEGRPIVHSGRENDLPANKPPLRISSRKAAKRTQSQPVALRV
ncbi:hypothetical protein BD324DRAFT_620565 [Kockovaella imperatae]|uniref:Uncharacterized protein n=1 Tax=Kockovaella imperatae TaxID=4999 RepID=A0A1Y1UJY3_9TREE|nr:hypothetical protein BD324DRAFT_620565 [Kockovaella imperatae]ORX38363.1 hypothetical protein BD324DRAFT_620565 [Kockovaella imperatae]